MLKFADAPCGAGKTHQIVERAVGLARSGERALILQPTRELIDKTVRDELLSHPNPPPHHVFHSGRFPGSVARILTEHLNDAAEHGQIVFATHAVLSLLGDWARKQGWHVLVDEALAVVRHNRYRLPDTHGILTDDIYIEPFNAIYGRVVAEDTDDIKTKARNKGEDDVYAHFAELTRTIANPHWDSFVNIEQFEKLKNGKGAYLSVHSILNPTVLDGFDTALIVGANFQESLNHKLWAGHYDVRITEDQSLADSLKFRSHPNGDLIDIYYATERSWSTKLRDKADDENGENTTLSRIARAAEGLFGGERFVWQANVSVPDTLFPGNAERLPNKPHGLNSYADIHNVVFLSALNPQTDHFRFLENLGISGGEVRAAICHAEVYQSVMRTSIRDTDNRELKKIIVPDHAMAEYLRDQFADARIHNLSVGFVDDADIGKLGRPRRYQFNKDRVAAQWVRAREEQARLLNDTLLLGISQDAQTKEGCGQGKEAGEKEPKIAAEKGIKPFTIFGSQLASGTLYRAKKSGFPDYYLEDCGDVDFFVDALRSFHKRKLPSKEDNLLISPAVFDPNKTTGTRRGRDNIVYLRHLWLDFEQGDLKPSELAELFPYTRVIATNSFNHTRKESRFRLVIPTNRPVPVDGYERLFDLIAAKIEDAGFIVERGRGKKAAVRSNVNLRRSGLDWSKRPASSLFYLPCQAKEPCESFFTDYNGSGREVLDPLLWIEHSVIPITLEPKPLTRCEPKEVNAAGVEKARSEWRQSSNFPGEGNTRFFQFAVDLRGAGLCLIEIEATLRAEANFGRSPKKRLNQIKSVMRSLAQSRTVN